LGIDASPISAHFAWHGWLNFTTCTTDLFFHHLTRHPRTLAHLVAHLSYFTLFSALLARHFHSRPAADFPYVPKHEVEAVHAQLPLTPLCHLAWRESLSHQNQGKR